MRLVNPKFAELNRLGKETMWTSPTIDIPMLESTRLKARNATKIELYPEQREVFNEVVDNTTGLIHAPTSFGKSVLSIALHQAWQGRTLVVCHSLQLVDQFTEEFNKFDKSINVTKYTGSIKDTTGDVVITTHTTFRKKYNFFGGFDNLIVDEADLMSSDKSLNAIKYCATLRKWGMTATVKTKYDDCNDSDNGILAEFYGDYVKGSEDESKNPFNKVISKVYKKVYTQNGHRIAPHNWIVFRKVLDADIDRKKAQIKWVLDVSTESESSILLFDRVVDSISWYKALEKRGIRAYLSNGEMKKEGRDIHLNGFKDNGGYLCAVYSTVGRGYSNTLITKAFVLFPLKSENTILQIVGRIKRFYDGKQSTLCLWSDSELEFQFKKQKSIIKKYYNL